MRRSRFPTAAPLALLVVAADPSELASQTADLGSRVDAAVERVTTEIIDLRHRIHQNPELGNREFDTARLVADHLRALGIEVETEIAHTGVVGVIEGGRPGPVVAVRADMDALPVTEQTDFPFRSTKTGTYLGQEVGISHACGHDIHVAVQLGVASVLAGLREDLPGTVVLIFQPAEEGPPPGEEGGAEMMVAEGVLAEPAPQAIFALHSWPTFEVGEVGWTVGPAMASSDHFRITIRGRQSHGAWPHESVDPVVTAAQAVLALQTIRSRNLDPREPGVLSVGMIQGGERYNIIPETVRLEGTVRTYSPAVQDTIERRIEEILDGVTRAAGATYELEYERNNPATINDPELAALMRPTLERVLGAGRVVDDRPVMGAEDFSFFANEIPGLYFRLGVVAPGTTSGGLHTPTFRGDDTAVPVGIRAMTHLVIDYLQMTAWLPPSSAPPGP
ncbi:MAG TPA: amidohydrolase [Gemmatimonadota bacterium]|nr:amidohydrolase [Gemmatimonadota bacterium]